jgi:hypothetical protein
MLQMKVQPRERRAVKLRGPQAPELGEDGTPSPTEEG